MTGPLASDRPRRRVRQRPILEGLEARSMMAYAGSFDPTFAGGTGYRLTGVGSAAGPGLVDVLRVAVEADGSVVVAGPSGQSGSQTNGVMHLNADGTPDASFGQGGVADVALPGGVAYSSGPSTLLVQPDGKVILVGLVTPTGGKSPLETLVARFDADGSPDSSFGTDGVVVLDQSTIGISNPSILFGALQADGEIVLAGGPGTQVIAVRLDPGGAVDATFGTNGVVTLSDIPPATPPAEPATEPVEGLAVQPDGKIVILASLQNQPTLPIPNATPELIRLDADGSRDTSMGQSGILSSGLEYPDATGLLVQPDGKILVLGTVPNQFDHYPMPVLARMNADGTFDRTATLPTAVSEASTLFSFALQPDGDVLLTGDIAPSIVADKFLATVRLTPKLTPDDTFGAQGVSKFAVEPPGANGTVSTPAYFTSLFVAAGPDNRAVVAGSNPSYFINTELPATYLVAARLTATGSAHPGDFTGDGIADPAAYLPDYGSFAIRPSQVGPDELIPFGAPGPGQTIPAPGDYTGSGREEVAAYIPAYGVYAYRPAGGGPDVIVPFGIAGAGNTIPAPGDYFGTGRDDLAVYLPSLGDFGLRNPGGGPDQLIPFGIAGSGRSIPVPGDYDGSGRTELAVYLPSLGAYAYRPAKGGPDLIEPFGLPGAGNTIPAPGDYDGSGRTELAVYLPSLGEFIYRPANGGADVAIPFGAAGSGRTLPAPGDYTGSGRLEVGAYLPDLGALAYRPAGVGTDVLVPFGIAGPGRTIPVTAVVLSPFPGTAMAASVSAASVEVPGISGDVVPLDLPATPKKRPRPGEASRPGPSPGPP